MEGPRAAPQPYFNVGLGEMFRVVPAVPEEMGPGPDPHGSPWELLTWAAVAVLTLLLFLQRSVQCVRSRLYLKRERKLALKLCEVIEEKCKLLDKVSLLEKEYKGLEASLQDVNSEKESKEEKILESINEMLNRCKSNIADKILFLEEKLRKEESKRSEQEDLMADTSERMKSLEEQSKSLKLQIVEAKTTLRLSQVNEDRLQRSIQEVWSENSELEASEKHLVEEAEGWKAKVRALVKEKTTFENSKVHVEEVLRDKESHLKSLAEQVLKRRGWDPALREDLPGDGELAFKVESERETGAHVEDQLKGLQELIYATKLNTSLENLEGERNKISALVSEVDKGNEHLLESIDNLEREQASLKSENAQCEQEREQLQHKFRVIMGEYQDNELKLQQKLVIEEKRRMEEEKRLSEVEKNISHAAEELETHKEQAKALEVEVDSTYQSYHRQIMSFEKKAHDNAMAARAADRNLKYLRQVNAYNQEKLAELELQFGVIEQDPHSLEISKIAFGCEPSPNGNHGDNSKVQVPSLLGKTKQVAKGFFSRLAPIRGPLLPGDPGSKFLRGGPGFPPPPPSISR